MNIITRHALATLPDSVGERRQILDAILAACPGSQYAGEISLLLEHLEQHHAMLQTKSRFSGGGPFAEAVRAVEDCRTKPLNDPVRVLLFLRDSDDETAGLPEELVRRFNAIRVEASPVGRNVSDCLPKSAGCDPTVLVVEKAVHLTRDDLDAFRRLVNSTRLVLVLLLTEEIWLKWNHRWPIEAGPIRRRAHAILPLTNRSPNK